MRYVCCGIIEHMRARKDFRVAVISRGHAVISRGRAVILPGRKG